MIPNGTVLIKFLFNWESKQNNQHIFINTFEHYLISGILHNRWAPFKILNLLTKLESSLEAS